MKSSCVYKLMVGQHSLEGFAQHLLRNATRPLITCRSADAKGAAGMSWCGICFLECAYCFCDASVPSCCPTFSSGPSAEWYYLLLLPTALHMTSRTKIKSICTKDPSRVAFSHLECTPVLTKAEKDTSRPHCCYYGQLCGMQARLKFPAFYM